MEPRSLIYVLEAMGGGLLSGSLDAPAVRVCTDSRSARPGDLFFALTGERFDGHDFLGAVMSKGVAAVVVERAKAPSPVNGCPVIGVENPRAALGRLATRYRQDFDLPIVAVGGSNGKTTTKELVAAVLREKFKTLWSEASFNNDIGVPITLLQLDQSHQAAVLEVGTNHPGEIAPLVGMIQPKFGVVTSIGREHLEFFGDVNGVAEEEGWLAELLPADGILFVNGDSPDMKQVIRRTRAKVVCVGLGEGNDWRANNVRLDASGVTFRAESSQPELSGEYRINLLGRHQVLNALLALAAGTELGLTREQMQRALAGCTPPKMRLQVWETNGVRVLDDAYNANADSMLAALQTLHDLPCTGRRVAVLGDMAELGAQQTAAHIEVGQRAAELGVNRLFAVGQMAAVTAAAARGRGLEQTSEFTDVLAAAAGIKADVRAGDLVLLKASRATRLERVGEILRGRG